MSDAARNLSLGALIKNTPPKKKSPKNITLQ